MSYIETPISCCDSHQIRHERDAATGEASQIAMLVTYSRYCDK